MNLLGRIGILNGNKYFKERDNSTKENENETMLRRDKRKRKSRGELAQW